MWKDIIEGIDGYEAQWLLTLACRLILLYASQFTRRVLNMVHSAPRVILKLMKSPSHLKCEDRMELATLVLAAPEARA
jgi:hypothetical protein